MRRFNKSFINVPAWAIWKTLSRLGNAHKSRRVALALAARLALLCALQQQA
jgi:hypothetical protein